MRASRTGFWSVVLIALVAVAIAPAADAALVAYWQFEGNTDDASGSGYDGTPVNSPTYAGGVVGQAIELNGSNQYVTTVNAAALGLQGNFTVSAWVRPDATNADRTILGTDQTGTNVGLHLVIRDSRAHMGFYGNDTGGVQTINTGQWQHLTWRFNNGEQALFVNGLGDRAGGGHANFAGNDIVNIGRWAGGRYFDGLMDEVRVYNTPLSNRAIAAAHGIMLIDDFEDHGTSLDPKRWYASSGSSTLRLRTNYNPGGTYGLLSSGAQNDPTATLTVYNSSHDSNTGIAWGPMFTVNDDSASLSFKVIGGSHGLVPGSQRAGGTGVALWDVDANDFVPGTFTARSSNSGSYEAQTIALTGLAGRNVVVALVDRQTGSWAWTGVDTIHAPAGAVTLKNTAFHRRVYLDYPFDNQSDFMGWQQVDGAGNPVAITSFQIGNSPGGLINRHINLKGTFTVGEGFLSSTTAAGGWDTPTGIIRSPEFTIQGDILEFYLAGGNRDGLAFELCANLPGVAGFTTVRSAVHQADVTEFDYDFWGIADLNGLTGYLQLVDSNPGTWGHIHVDGIRMVGFFVPEPATLTLLGLGGLGMLVRRRRKQRGKKTMRNGHSVIVALLAVGLLLSAPTASADLVAHYDFEEGTGTTVNDVSGNGRTGTLNNPTGSDWVAGYAGNYALDLTASGAYVSTLNSLASQMNVGGNNPRTVTAWVKARTYNDGAVFDLGATGSAGEEFCLRTTTNAEQYRAQFWSTPDFDATAYGSQDTWVHMALVHDGSQGRMYMNGFAIGAKTSTVNTNDGRSFEIGRYGGGTTIDGSIDDVRVYDEALSQQQMQALAGTSIGAADRIAASFTLGAADQAAVLGMKMHLARSNSGAVNTIDEGEQVLEGSRTAGSGSAVVVQTVDHGDGGHFSGAQAFPGGGGDNYAVEVSGVVDIPFAGDYVVGVNSDDGFRLRVGTRDIQVCQAPAPRGPSDTMTSVHFDQPGLYPFSLTYFELGGGEEVEFFGKLGSNPVWDGSEVLIGDVANGSMAVYQNVVTAPHSIASAVTTPGAGFVSARHVAKTGVTVSSLWEGEQLLDGTLAPDVVYRDATPNLDHGGVPVAADDYASEYKGVLNIQNPGVHSFTVNSDDGFRLRIGNGLVISEANYPRGGTDTTVQAAFLSAGLYPFSLAHFERGGGNTARLLIDGLQVNDAAATVQVYPMAGARAAQNPSGYQGFLVRQVTADGVAINNVYDGLRLLDGQLPAAGETVRHDPVVNLWGSGGHGNYGAGPNEFAFPLGGGDDFAVQATGYLHIPSAGFYTFGVNSDDGFLLEIGGEAVCEFYDPRGPVDTLSSVYFPDEGLYYLALTYFERGGGDEVELFAAQGLYTAWNANDFHLVGDVAAGGLGIYQVPEPGTLALLGLGLLGVARRRRRRSA